MRFAVDAKAASSLQYVAAQQTDLGAVALYLEVEAYLL